MGPGTELRSFGRAASALSPIKLGVVSNTLELTVVKIVTNWALFCLIVLILIVLFRISVAELHWNYFIVITEFKPGFVEIPVL